MNKKLSLTANIISGLSFICLSLLSTRSGNGRDALILFFCTGILFSAGIILKILSDRNHQYWLNFLPALGITACIFLGDLFLKWIMLDQQTLQSFGSVFFKVVTVYPVQPMDELQYRSFDPAVLLFLSLLFRDQKKVDDKISFSSALLQLIGDNLPCFLIADILVSTFPAYWNGSRPGVMRLFFDLLMGLVITAVSNGYLKQKDPVNQKIWDVCLHSTVRTEKIRFILYCFIFGYLFFYQFFNTTMFPAWLTASHPQILGYLNSGYMLMIALSALSAVFSVFEADKKYEKNIIAVCLFLGFIFYGNSQNGAVYTLLMLTAGAVKKNGRTILSIAFAEGLTIMILAWIGVRKGILTDVIVDNRHGLGIIYATDCYAHWFYLFAAYCLIRRGRFHWFEYPISLLLFMWLYKLTKADTNLICFLILWAAMLIRQYIMPKFEREDKPSSFSKVFVWSYVICAACFFIALKHTEELAPFLQTHFYTLWQRLFYSRQGLQTYKIKFLYQAITEHGNGMMDYVNNQFFYLDVSYIRILLMDGILVFAYIMGICTWFLNHARKRKWGMLFIILTVIALQSMVEQRLPEYWYNIFIILPLADFGYLRNKS